VHRALVNAQAARIDAPNMPMNDMESSSLFYRRMTESFCEREHVACLDCLPAFAEATRAGKTLFNDDVHFSQEGHRLMADLLADLIREKSAELGLQQQRPNGQSDR